MDFKALLQKYQALLAENQALKVRLNIAEPLESRPSPQKQIYFCITA